MGKKLIGIAIAAIMLFGIFGLTACDNVSLADYKITAVTAIESHANTMKAENGYRAEGYAAIEDAVEAGKQAVYVAETKIAVNTARDTAIQTITNVPKEEEMSEILSQFDLTDPKITWNGNIDEDFTDDIVLVTLRKTSTYPELQMKHFGLNNAESLEYVGGVRPPDYFFTDGYEEALGNYRQIVFIHIKPQGKDAVIETIRRLEKLEFVRSASPNNVDSGG